MTYVECRTVEKVQWRSENVQRKVPGGSEMRCTKRIELLGWFEKGSRRIRERFQVCRRDVRRIKLRTVRKVTEKDPKKVKETCTVCRVQNCWAGSKKILEITEEGSR